MRIAHTRAMVRAALSGQLTSVPAESDPIFGFEVPTACPDVPSEILKPRNTWKDKKAFDQTAWELAGMFRKNFEKFAAETTPEVRAAGPRDKA